MEDILGYSSAFFFGVCPVFLYLCVFMTLLWIPVGSTVESQNVFGLFSRKYSRVMGEDGAWGGPGSCQGGDLEGCAVSKQVGERESIRRVSVSLSPVCSFCFLLGCTHRLPTAPRGIALLLPQLQSVHISLN